MALILHTGAADVETAVQRFVSCTEKIESWMSSNRLKMNADKTQVIWIGSRQQLAKVDIKEFQLLSANILFSTTVSNLGVHLDSRLTMQDHVAAMCRSCFFQLRQLRTIRSSLTTDAAKTLAQAFVGGRLDYCNSLLYGVSGELLRRLQSVQNAAARFITGTRKYDHITPVLRSLHWLPVRQRIIFKIATLMYRCLNGLAPSYLAADCTVVSAIPGRRQLRSATSGQLYIPRTRTVTFGPRSFKVCGPTIWNDLPARMKDPSLSFDSFRKLLKTFLFDKWLLHERICGSCINLRGEMCIIIIIIIIIYISLISELGVRIIYMKFNFTKIYKSNSTCTLYMCAHNTRDFTVSGIGYQVMQIQRIVSMQHTEGECSNFESEKMLGWQCNVMLCKGYFLRSDASHRRMQTH